MINPPRHLENIKNTTASILFEAGEFLFRRISEGECPEFPLPLTYDSKDLFNKISSGNFIPGLSMNRSEMSKPEDVLWSYKYDSSSETCSWTYRQGIVIGIQVEKLADLRSSEYPHITLFCCHTPNECNRSHSEIRCDPVLTTDSDKKLIRNVRALLAIHADRVNV